MSELQSEAMRARFWLVGWSRVATWDQYRNKRSYGRKRVQRARERFSEHAETYHQMTVCS